MRKQEIKIEPVRKSVRKPTIWGPTYTQLYSHRSMLEACNFGFGKKRNSINGMKTKVLISCAVTAQLIFAFVFHLCMLFVFLTWWLNCSEKPFSQSAICFKLKNIPKLYMYAHQPIFQPSSPTAHRYFFDSHWLYTLGTAHSWINRDSSLILQWLPENMKQNMSDNLFIKIQIHIQYATSLSYVL